MNAHRSVQPAQRKGRWVLQAEGSRGSAVGTSALLSSSEKCGDVGECSHHALVMIPFGLPSICGVPSV